MRPSTKQCVALVILIVVSTSVVGCIIPPFEADCSSATSCESCLESSGCGLCLTTGDCLPGTAFGPDDESLCSPSLWRFASCTEQSRACNDSCSYANDGDCDEAGIAGLCDPGTDCTDCRNAR